MNLNKKGVSLIVLVITIVVMIILAAAVILSLNNNNPIGNARQTKFSSDVNSFRDELNVHIADQRLDSASRGETYAKEDDPTLANVSSKEDLSKIISTMKDDYVGKIKIVKGEIVYAGTSEEEKAWAEKINIKTTGSSKVDFPPIGDNTLSDGNVIISIAPTIPNENEVVKLEYNYTNTNKTEPSTWLESTVVGKIAGYSYGDANMDGTITSSDSQLALKFSTGGQTPNNTQRIICDVDGNGKLESYDSLLITQYVEGKISSFAASKTIRYNGYLYGDANMDGTITEADAQLVLQISTGKVKPNSTQLVICDVDGDGQVDSYDSLLISQYANKTITKFPIEPKLMRQVISAAGTYYLWVKVTYADGSVVVSVSNPIVVK